jgi:hypothetical protein
LRILLLPAALVATSIVAAGASVLSLNGSDRAPYEKEFSALCYSGITIETPLSSKNGGKDFKVHEVVVSGNFQGCPGYTMLLTASLNSKKMSYAFHEIQPNESTFTLVFSSGKPPGDWRTSPPRVTDGKLYAEGALTHPQASLDVENITWVVGDNW